MTVDHVALTRGQCVDYQLPRTPIKETDRRRGSFEARHGEGATELDALEALHPGSLSNVITAAVDPLIDRGLRARLDRARSDAYRLIHDAWEQRGSAELQDAADRISAEATDRLTEHVDRLRELFEEQIADLEGFSDSADELIALAQHHADQIDVELPARPEPETAVPEADGLLFDSRRHWVDQLAVFKSRQNGHGNGDTP